MFDLFILFDSRSYYNRNELIINLGLLQQSNINGEERYSKNENEKYIIAEFTKNTGYYVENEITLPYNLFGECHLSFYPFEIIKELLSAIISFNSELFIDDDHDNILSVCDFKNLVEKRKVYPYTYCHNDFF